VFFEGSDEDLSGITSLVLEFNFSVININSSLGDPFKISLSVSDFLFEILSVGGGSVTSGLVVISNRVEIGDFRITSGLLGLILFVGSILSIITSLS